MVSLNVCARGLAAILSRIGYRLVKPLLQFLPHPSSCASKETKRVAKRATHEVLQPCLPIRRHPWMVSHVCGFELQHESYPIGFPRLT